MVGRYACSRSFATVPITAEKLPPSHEHLPRKWTLLSTAVKHERGSYAMGRTSLSASSPRSQTADFHRRFWRWGYLARPWPAARGKKASATIFVEIDVGFYQGALMDVIAIRLEAEADV
jgi:hypothetical protein